MNIAVIFAGGVGSRMNSKNAMPKQFLKLHGKPILIHTLEVFEQTDEIDAIVIACVKEWKDYTEKLITEYGLKKIKRVVVGGINGQASIFNGLKAAKEISESEKDIVLIHDGVRPLIYDKTIRDNIVSVEENGSAITSVAVKETVLIVEEGNKIVEIPNRTSTKLARAPQSFYLNDIYDVHCKAVSEGKTEFIDCCSMMQYYGYQLFLIDGPEENIKITTPDDFYMMRAALDAKENEQIYGYSEK